VRHASGAPRAGVRDRGRRRETAAGRPAGKPTRSLTARASYSIAPGKQRTITLKLSAAGRRAIKQKRSVKVRVTIRTSAGVSASRRLNLQRRGS